MATPALRTNRKENTRKHLPIYNAGGSEEPRLLALKGKIREGTDGYPADSSFLSHLVWRRTPDPGDHDPPGIGVPQHLHARVRGDGRARSFAAFGAPDERGPHLGVV